MPGTSEWWISGIDARNQFCQHSPRIWRACTRGRMGNKNQAVAQDPEQTSDQKEAGRREGKTNELRASERASGYETSRPPRSAQRTPVLSVAYARESEWKKRRMRRASSSTTHKRRMPIATPGEGPCASSESAYITMHARIDVRAHRHPQLDTTMPPPLLTAMPAWPRCRTFGAARAYLENLGRGQASQRRAASPANKAWAEGLGLE
ncbi:hypothetical protein DFH09DRAFT_1096296 [Mycena vulgaris]|nr:hypothetical protein DFH09DRAFT_1096296 [Mycena vulgaris]